jgi:hypothetical protein
LTKALRFKPRHSNRRLFQIGDMILVAASFTAAQFLTLGDDFWLNIQVEPLSSLGSLAFVFA